MTLSPDSKIIEPVLKSTAGVVAHAFFPEFGGDAHFDDQELWTINKYTVSRSEFQNYGILGFCFGGCVTLNMFESF